MFRYLPIVVSLVISPGWAGSFPTIDELEKASREAGQLMTISELTALKSEMDASFAAGDCKKAMELVVRYMPMAILTEKIVSMGNAPANSVETPDARPAVADRMAKAQEKTRIGRAEAIINPAECAASVNGTQGAIGGYAEALSLLPSSGTALWTRAAEGLWKQMGGNSPLMLASVR